MADAGSFLHIVPAVGGDRRSRMAARKIAKWVSNRIWFHRSRFELEEIRKQSSQWTSEFDEDTGRWEPVPAEVDYEFAEYKAWNDFLTWMWNSGRVGRTVARTSQIKEELIANVFHPSRVEKWLEMGEDVLDMMMGA